MDFNIDFEHLSSVVATFITYYIYHYESESFAEVKRPRDHLFEELSEVRAVHLDEIKAAFLIMISCNY